MRAFPILVYGSVDGDPHPGARRWSVSREVFQQQMRYLRAEGWRTFTVSELLSQVRHGDELPERCIAVSFDEGLEDVLTAGLPAMQGMRGTVYVSSGQLRDVGGADAPPPGRMLDRRQLSLLRQSGFEVGVHGHRHVALDEMRRHKAEADIETGKRVVEEAIGEEVSSFSYPYGYYDYAVQQMVGRSGFANAVALKSGWTHERDDRWAIARIRILPSTTLGRFEELLSTPRPVSVTERDTLAAMGSRTARRVRRILEVS